MCLSDIPKKGYVLCVIAKTISGNPQIYPLFWWGVWPSFSPSLNRYTPLPFLDYAFIIIRFMLGRIWIQMRARFMISIIMFTTLIYTQSKKKYLIYILMVKSLHILYILVHIIQHCRIADEIVWKIKRKHILIGPELLAVDMSFFLVVQLKSVYQIGIRSKFGKNLCGRGRRKGMG